MFECISCISFSHLFISSVALLSVCSICCSDPVSAAAYYTLLPPSVSLCLPLCFCLSLFLSVTVSVSVYLSVFLSVVCLSLSLCPFGFLQRVLGCVPGPCFKRFRVLCVEHRLTKDSVHARHTSHFITCKAYISLYYNLLDQDDILKYNGQGSTSFSRIQSQQAWVRP